MAGLKPKEKQIELLPEKGRTVGLGDFTLKFPAGAVEKKTSFNLVVGGSLNQISEKPSSSNKKLDGSSGFIEVSPTISCQPALSLVCGAVSISVRTGLKPSGKRECPVRAMKVEDGEWIPLSDASVDNVGFVEFECDHINTIGLFVEETYLPWFALSLCGMFFHDEEDERAFGVSLSTEYHREKLAYRMKREGLYKQIVIEEKLVALLDDKLRLQIGKEEERFITANGDFIRKSGDFILYPSADYISAGTKCVFIVERPEINGPTIVENRIFAIPNCDAANNSGTQSTGKGKACKLIFHDSVKAKTTIIGGRNLYVDKRGPGVTGQPFFGTGQKNDSKAKDDSDRRSAGNVHFKKDIETEGLYYGIDGAYIDERTGPVDFEDKTGKQDSERPAPSGDRPTSSGNEHIRRARSYNPQRSRLTSPPSTYQFESHEVEAQEQESGPIEELQGNQMGGQLAPQSLDYRDHGRGGSQSHPQRPRQKQQGRGGSQGQGRPRRRYYSHGHVVSRARRTPFRSYHSRDFGWQEQDDEDGQYEVPEQPMSLPQGHGKRTGNPRTDNRMNARPSQSQMHQTPVSRNNSRAGARVNMISEELRSMSSSSSQTLANRNYSRGNRRSGELRSMPLPVSQSPASRNSSRVHETPTRQQQERELDLGGEHRMMHGELGLQNREWVDSGDEMSLVSQTTLSMVSTSSESLSSAGDALREFFNEKNISWPGEGIVDEFEEFLRHRDSRPQVGQTGDEEGGQCHMHERPRPQSSGGHGHSSTAIEQEVRGLSRLNEHAETSNQQQKDDNSRTQEKENKSSARHRDGNRKLHLGGHLSLRNPQVQDSGDERHNFTPLTPMSIRSESNFSEIPSSEDDDVRAQKRQSGSSKQHRDDDDQRCIGGQQSRLNPEGQDSGDDMSTLTHLRQMSLGAANNLSEVPSSGSTTMEQQVENPPNLNESAVLEKQQQKEEDDNDVQSQVPDDKAPEQHQDRNKQRCMDGQPNPENPEGHDSGDETSSLGSETNGDSQRVVSNSSQSQYNESSPDEDSVSKPLSGTFGPPSITVPKMVVPGSSAKQSLCKSNEVDFSGAKSNDSEDLRAWFKFPHRLHIDKLHVALFTIILAILVPWWMKS